MTENTGQALVSLLWTTVMAAGLMSQLSTANAAEHIVRIVSDYENLRMVFEPKYLEIKSGDRVTWINEADEEHNVISFPDGFPRGAKALQSPIMTKTGERWSHDFEISGSYEYHCLPHLPMGMRGSIIVDRHSNIDEFHDPSIDEIRDYRTLMLNWFDEDDIEEIELEDRTSHHKEVGSPD